MATAKTPSLDLASAAEELGVHYQTAYRWVRSGRLPAVVIDGRYRIDPDDVTLVAASRRTPTDPAPPRPRRRDRSAERMYELLVDGDEPAASALARELVDEGMPIIELLEHVIAPPLRRIGQAWVDGELTIPAEHRASAIVERMLGSLAPNPRGRRRGTVVVAAVAGDRHVIATTMAAIALRDDNWRVHHLGADLPVDELVRFCEQHDVSAVALSVTGGVSATVDGAADRLRRAGVPVVTGGPGRTLTDLIGEIRAAARTGVRR